MHSRRRRCIGIWLLLAACVACSDGGGRGRLPDAAPDGPPTAAPQPARDFTGGAQHVRGARFAADVQIGHPIGQQPVTRGARHVEGNAAVKP